MGAYENALREEGSRDDLMRALEKAWTEKAELEAEVSKARKQAELAHHAADRWVPCPDHRDKVSTERDGCQVCRAETAEAEVERLRYVVEAARPFPKLLRGVRDSDIRDAVTTLYDRIVLSEKEPT